MKYKNTTMIVLSALALGLSTVGSAASTDTLDASNPGIGPTYWVPSEVQKYAAPYYRHHNEDWGWTHNGIAEAITTGATLRISSFDIDIPHEVDNIYAWNTGGAGSWVLLGKLTGSQNDWSFNEFTLGASWYDEIGLGLKVMMDIDAEPGGTISWGVSLAKSVLTVNGGDVPPPTPGEVPIPAAAFMFAPALLGFMGLRRRAKNKA